MFSFHILHCSFEMCGIISNCFVLVRSFLVIFNLPSILVRFSYLSFLPFFLQSRFCKESPIFLYFYIFFHCCFIFVSCRIAVCPFFQPLLLLSLSYILIPLCSFPSSLSNISTVLLHKIFLAKGNGFLINYVFFY